MDANNLFSVEWTYLRPEMIVLGGAVLLALLDLLAGRRLPRQLFGWLALVSVVLAGAAIWQNIQTVGQPIGFMADMLRIDSFGNAFKLLFVSGVAFTFLLSFSHLQRDAIPHHGEYSYLLLIGLLGAMVMASSADLITMFVGLELLSLSSYILVGIRKHRLASNESAFKYVVSGGIASAFTLFGMSYLYGLSGTTNLHEMTSRIGQAANSGFGAMVLISFVFLVAGLTFKIAAAPNHMWAPDVYQGAPTPVTAYLAVVSKAAGFALIVRLVLLAYGGVLTEQGQSLLLTELSGYLSIIAGLTMMIGNLMALRQVHLKRLMAYSGIAHAGYLLIPFVSLTQLSFEQVIFYLLAYLVGTFGLFAAIETISRDQRTEELKGFAGLYHRAPVLAVAVTILVVSLAGLPVTAGFFGKFYLLMSALANGRYWLTAIMLATSTISFFYYFGFIRQMYMRSGETEASVKIPAGAAFIIGVAALATLLGGLFPGLPSEFIHQHFNSGFDLGGIMKPGE
ncbi:NADH-quinone oxidoreductase subunit NuoN [Brevibacillus fulvus]|uniref:NADH-quinone oxidoreductase subunit N n=1 Tax=Brevibacillus fulvus TaxID=1125967 RepID=A0A938XU64_9BACL|nr:NADH-quinone oxidoreductase subunit NuoN [Brevibacillus fulvus]MBM7590167.1 NADH-quinone oxidoreductase subunit N [Brevibacillus fulvus]